MTHCRWWYDTPGEIQKVDRRSKIYFLGWSILVKVIVNNKNGTLSKYWTLLAKDIKSGETYLTTRILQLIIPPVFSLFISKKSGKTTKFYSPFLRIPGNNNRIFCTVPILYTIQVIYKTQSTIQPTIYALKILFPMNFILGLYILFALKYIWDCHWFKKGNVYLNLVF